MRRLLRACLFAAVALASLVALSGRAFLGRGRGGGRRAAVGRGGAVPLELRPAHLGPRDSRPLAGRLRYLLGHGGHRLARVRHSHGGGAGPGLLREQPRRPHGLAARLPGHGPERARGGLLRALGGSGAGELGPVPAPGPVSRVPARRPSRPGGPLPAAARARHAGQRRGQVGGHDLRRRRRGDRLRHQREVPLLERRDELLLRTARTSSTTTCCAWAGTTPYSADRFAIRPPGDGAFLIKNSWGTGFGEQGYFWLSYYDASFGKALAVFDGVASVDDYDAIYQYDALGRSGWIGAGGGESAWYASRFSCAGSGDVAAVSFYTPVPGTEYEVRVAGSVQDVASAPVAAAGTVAGRRLSHHPSRASRGGHRRRGLRRRRARPTPGWNRPVPVERPTALIAPRARAGQSYVSADGATWSDLTARDGALAGERLPQGVRHRVRRRGHAAAARGRHRRRRPARRHGRGPLAPHGPRLLQRQRHRRAHRARRRRRRGGQSAGSRRWRWESAGPGASGPPGRPAGIT